MSKVELIDALAAWHERSHQAANARGILMTFGRSGGERPKHSGWLNFEREDRFGELMVWDSGEAELSYGREGNPEILEHHDISEVSELHGLLDRLMFCLLN